MLLKKHREKIKSWYVKNGLNHLLGFSKMVHSCSHKHSRVSRMEAALVWGDSAVVLFLALMAWAVCCGQ